MNRRPRRPAAPPSTTLGRDRALAHAIDRDTRLTRAEFVAARDAGRRQRLLVVDAGAGGDDGPVLGVGPDAGAAGVTSVLPAIAAQVAQMNMVQVNAVRPMRQRW